MAEFEDFHRDFLPRFIKAQRAFHDGDAGPNIALWSGADPVTLFAARGWCDSGTEHVTKTFSAGCLRVLRRTRRRVGAHRLRSERGSGLHGRRRALHGVDPRRSAGPDRAPGHPCVPPRGRTVAGGAPPMPTASRPTNGPPPDRLPADSGHPADRRRPPLRGQSPASTPRIKAMPYGFASLSLDPLRCGLRSGPTRRTPRSRCARYWPDGQLACDYHRATTVTTGAHQTRDVRVSTIFPRAQRLLPKLVVRHALEATARAMAIHLHEPAE
jgi:hypothetical protein